MRGALAAALALVFDVSQACTTVAISAGATLDDAAMTMHTSDCSQCDQRLALVPGRIHPQGAKHPVYGVAAVFPRMKSDRATIYQDVPDGPVPLAHIPEIERTFGVFESSYALMNEEGLTLGESTCESKIPAAGIDMPDEEGKLGKAYLSISALMQLGLERCATARCAIKSMGGLAEQYGFYGEDLMTGETLAIADTTGEAWIFHIMQDHTTNVSAIWVAQRVPQGHIAVVANEFIIQNVPDVPGEDFIYSENLRSEAIAAGFWNGTGEFNFQQVYGRKTEDDFLYSIALRLQWIYSQVAPSLELPLFKSRSQYQFSYPVDHKLSVEAAIETLRGHYDGTNWDLTKGILAGPFGNPNRLENGLGLEAVPGALPRPISIPRTSYAHIGIANKKNPVALYAPDEPSMAVFAPFFTETLKHAATLPLKETAILYSHYYQIGRRDQFAYKQSAWWGFDAVSNLCNLYYSNMTQMHVFPAIKEWQPKMLDIVRKGDIAASVKAQDELIEAWWELYDLLMVRYNDGTYNYYLGHDPQEPFVAIGYPESWLLDIGFNNDFWQIQTVQGQVAKQCKQNESATLGDDTTLLIIGTHFATLLIGLIAGVLLHKYCAISNEKLEAENVVSLLASDHLDVT